MSYKTILVHLDAGTRRTERLNLAFRLAEEFDAHLIGLFALEPVYMPPTPEAAPVLFEVEHRRREEALRAAKEEFVQVSRREQWVKCEWRATEDSLAAVRLHARYADLVIAGQPAAEDESDGGVPEWFSQELVMTAGRPVLLVPHAGHFEDVFPYPASLRFGVATTGTEDDEATRSFSRPSSAVALP